MKRRLLLLLLAMGSGALSASAQPPPPGGDGLPLKPIAPATYQTWSNTFRLANDALTVVIVPELGRIVYLAPAHGSNLLHQGKAPNTPGTFSNLGGDWIWPCAQSRWQRETGADWPPPAFVADGPWTGHAWKSDDGRQHALLQRTYPTAIGIELSRHFVLEPDEARLAIRQRAERTTASSIPVCLWQVSQVRGAPTCYLPVGTSSAFDKGYRIWMGDPPPGTVARVDDVLVIHPGSDGGFKVGTDSPRAWIAARLGDHLILERAVSTAVPPGVHPDGGCVTELYASGGGQYVELESLTVEAGLAQGEAMENTVILSLHTLPEDANEQAVMALLKSFTGEASLPVP